MKAGVLWFDGRRRVEIREEELPDPDPGQVRVETRLSAISAGTELLFYRGELPGGLAVDSTLGEYAAPLSYPLRYGYACVGVVTGAGEGVAPSMEGRRVFAFASHASAFLARADAVVLIPDGVPEEDAAFLASMETAVTLVLDGHPRLGDRVSVFGLGTVGLAVTALLTRFPLAQVRGYDLHLVRRQAAAAAGAVAVDPVREPPPMMTEDVVFELTGSPEAFRTAVGTAAYSGLVVIGSWFGAKAFPAMLSPEVDGRFNTAFHRNRIRMITSQVSTIDPELSGRWNRQRRFLAAWEAIRALRPSCWVTHRVPFQRAGEAYGTLAERPGEAIQVLLTY